MLVFADRVKESASVAGGGPYTLTGAIVGFQGFVAALGDGAKCAYCAESGAAWEVGEGTLDAAAGTLSRDRILSSSNLGTAVSWPAGTVALFCVAPASVIQRLANNGVIVSTDGPLQVMTGTARWYPPQAVAFGSMEAWVGTTPAGSAIQFTLRKNGTSTATGSIAAGSQRMVATPITLALTPLDWLTLDVTQVGSSVVGMPRLTVSVISPTARFTSPRTTPGDRSWIFPMMARSAAEEAIGDLSASSWLDAGAVGGGPRRSDGPLLARKSDKRESFSPGQQIDHLFGVAASCRVLCLICARCWPGGLLWLAGWSLWPMVRRGWPRPR
ncbi:MAG: hypothetical protein HQL91_13955, partial [Magnetococcales bacterium]|nr:hypothetical protein [Magnetococcales bacterium]